MTPLIIRFPKAGPLLSLNDRQHWATRHRLTKAWRSTACQAAWQIRHPRAQPPSTVEIVIPFARNARRDPHNYVPTLKAVIDGLVDAGFWPDDTPAYVRTVEPRLVIGRGDIEVRLTPISDQENP